MIATPLFHPAPVRAFVQEGAKPAKVATTTITGQLGGSQDWKLLADLSQRLSFPSEIATTNLSELPIRDRNNIPQARFWWSSTLSSVYIIELTVPWEDAVGETYERKSLRYTELAADAEQRG